jgi:hypothetical protein
MVLRHAVLHLPCELARSYSFPPINFFDQWNFCAAVRIRLHKVGVSKEAMNVCDESKEVSNGLNDDSLEVNLRERKDADEIVRQLSANNRLASLVSLTLEYTEINDAILHCIGKDATSLTSLNLNACQQLTDDGMTGLAKNVSSLTNLSLYWNVKIGDSGVEQICRANTNILSLKLSGCKRLTDVGVASFTSCSKNLTMLDLTRCSNITDVGLQEVSMHCTSLKTLLLYAASGFGDVGVAALFSSLHHLEILDLCGAGRLTDTVGH